MKAQAIPPRLRFEDNNGLPLIGGKVYTYAAGTSTPQTTWTDSTGNTANANPIILDSRGEADIWLGELTYKFVTKDANEVEIDTTDNVSTSLVLSLSSGASNIGFIQSGSGAVQTTVESELRQTVTPIQFGAWNDGTHVVETTAAFAAAAVRSKNIVIPEGTYLLDGWDLGDAHGYHIEGASTTGVILKGSASATHLLKVAGSAPGGLNTYNTFKNFKLDMTAMSTTPGVAFGLYLKNTWGNSFYNVNIDVVSENQRSLYMGQHVYTSVFDNCDFGSTLGVVEVNGYYLGVTYSVTTLTFIGCSFGQAVLANASGVTLLQPIVQGALNKFQMNDIAGLTIIGGDIEGTGTYLAFGTGCLNVVSLNNVLLGFSGTYKSGSLLGGTLMDQTNDPYSMSNSNGTATALTINGAVEENMTIATLMRKVVRASHATSQQVDINLKNTNGDTYVGMTAPGDTFIDARGASGKIVLQQGGVDRIGMEASAKLIINALTSGTAGALVGYLQFTDGTTTYKIPYYAV